jgi:hypothetical protein
VTTQRARKARADAEYAKARAQRFVQARGRCPEPATQTHHVVRRSQCVDHDAANLRCLCLSHHELVHREVAWSKANGWIVSNWSQL